MKRKEAIEYIDKMTDILNRMEVRPVKTTSKDSIISDKRVLGAVKSAYMAGLLDAQLLLQEGNRGLTPKVFTIDSMAVILSLIEEHERDADD